VNVLTSNNHLLQLVIRFLKLLLPLALLASAQASVSINATLTDQQGNPVPFAFLEVQLVNCGAYVPAVPGGPLSIVAKTQKFTPSQLPATIYANNEITCGNAYSTLYHITAWADSNTKLAGDYNYDLCSTTTNCLGAATPTWNLAQSQPFTGQPPPPGFGAIFANPVQSQLLNQPIGTSLRFLGIMDFTGATVLGISGTGSKPSGSDTFVQFNQLVGGSNVFGSSPAFTYNYNTSTLNPTNMSASGSLNVTGSATVGSPLTSNAGQSGVGFTEDPLCLLSAGSTFDQLCDHNGHLVWNPTGLLNLWMLPTVETSTPPPDGSIYTYRAGQDLLLPVPNVLFSSTGNISSTNWALCNPLINGSNGQATSARFWDASCFPGATINAKVNTCLAFPYTNLGGRCDASALGLTTTGTAYSQTGQINVFEPLPPTCTAVTGGSLGSSLQFNLAYDFLSPKGESAVSEECGPVTTDASCPGSGKCQIQMTLPSDYQVINGTIGFAAQFKPKMTAGSAGSPSVWTEKDCGLPTAVGTTATISSSCSGANIVKTNPEVVLTFPPSGQWLCTITDGVSKCLKWGDRGFPLGWGMGEGQRFSIIGNGTTSVSSMCGSDTNAKSTTGYQRVEGIACNLGGGTASVATVSIQNFPDASKFRDVEAVATSGVGMLVQGGGGGAGSELSVHAECGSNTGCIPCQFGQAGSPSPAIDIKFGCVHPGSGQHAVEVLGGAGGLNLWGYTEANATDTTTPIMAIGTVGGAGPVNVLGLSNGKQAGGSTAYLIEIENHVNQVGIAENLYSTQSTNLINDLFSGQTKTCTSACQFAGPYVWGGFGGTAQFNTGVTLGGLFGVQQTGTTSPCTTAYAPTNVNTGSATTTTALNCLPANSVIDAVVYRVTTAITTAASFTVGQSGSTSQFCGTQSTLTIGATGTCVPAAYAAQTSAAPVVVTFNATPGAGALRLIVYYHTFVPPTS
jgi:hypothetical protein